MTRLTAETYHQSVRANFSFLKEAGNLQEAMLRAVAIPGGGFLVPLAKVHADDAPLAVQWSGWQKQKKGALPYPAESSGFKAWLEAEYLPKADEVLFLVTNDQGHCLGHLGFTGCHDEAMQFHLAHLLIDQEQTGSQAFAFAVRAAVEWARVLLPVAGFVAEIPSSDESMASVLRDAGFEAAAEPHATGTTRLCWARPLTEPGSSMILTAGPSISAREASYAFDAAQKGWNSEWSKYLTRFEQAFAKYVGVKYAMATSSCTGALQIAMMACGIGPGDEVIVPDETWVATANAVRYAGATPVFADIELDTWNLDADSVESLITPHTKAIVPVHMYGHPARMTRLVELARRRGIHLIEDAAPAIGAQWQGQKCGSFGDFAAFSFQGAKLMVTGEGGMLVTNDDRLYQLALKIWDQGRNPDRVFWIDGHGVKFKMSNVQAALGLGQLERVDELIELKRRVFSWYEEGLQGVGHIRLNREVEGARSIYWMSSLFLDEASGTSRQDLMTRLKARKVDTRPVFPAISQYPIWPREQPPQPRAMRVGQNALNLPSGVCLRKDEVMYVCRAIRDILGGSR